MVQHILLANQKQQCLCQDNNHSGMKANKMAMDDLYFGSFDKGQQFCQFPAESIPKFQPISNLCCLYKLPK